MGNGCYHLLGGLSRMLTHYTNEPKCEHADHG
jgi:hypothetical protein